MVKSQTKVLRSNTLKQLSAPLFVATGAYINTVGITNINVFIKFCMDATSSSTHSYACVGLAQPNASLMASHELDADDSQTKKVTFLRSATT